MAFCGRTQPSDIARIWCNLRLIKDNVERWGLMDFHKFPQLVANDNLLFTNLQSVFFVDVFQIEQTN